MLIKIMMMAMITMMRTMTNHNDEVGSQDASGGGDHCHYKPVEETKEITCDVFVSYGEE